MICICDIEKNEKTGKVEVVDQRDFYIPQIKGLDPTAICSLVDCALLSCSKCVYYRIQQATELEKEKWV